MIRKLRVKSFRSINDSKDVKLSNLNVFVGPNNSGKSSFLYALLILKQTLQDKDTRATLITTGPHVDLGSYFDIIRGHNHKEKLEFSFGIKTDTLPKIGFGIGKSRKKITPYSDCKVTLGLNLKANIIEVVAFEMGNKEKRLYFSGKKLNGNWKIEGIPETLRPHLGLDFDHFVPYLFPKGRGPKDSEKIHEGTEICLRSQMRIRLLQELFDRILYVGPIRERIPHYGILGTMPYTELGPSGQNLMRVLSESVRVAPSRKTLINELNHWLDNKFKILTNIRIHDIDDSKTIKALIADDPKGEKNINLAATGSGLSQIVPVIVQTVLTPINGCLIIEQPEIHLHPSAQADLGDLFVEYAKQKRQLIIETHSEHLLLRIRRRIAEKKISSEMVKVYFVQKWGGATKFRPLELSDNGHFIKLPRGFFEESYKEAMAIAKTQMKKKR
jgi:predicted ATPase